MKSKRPQVNTGAATSGPEQSSRPQAAQPRGNAAALEALPEPGSETPYLDMSATELDGASAESSGQKGHTVQISSGSTGDEGSEDAAPEPDTVDAIVSNLRTELDEMLEEGRGAITTWLQRFDDELKTATGSLRDALVDIHDEGREDIDLWRWHAEDLLDQTPDVVGRNLRYHYERLGGVEGDDDSELIWEAYVERSTTRARESAISMNDDITNLLSALTDRADSLVHFDTYARDPIDQALMRQARAEAPGDLEELLEATDEDFSGHGRAMASLTIAVRAFNDEHGGNARLYRRLNRELGRIRQNQATAYTRWEAEAEGWRARMAEDPHPQIVEDALVGSHRWIQRDLELLEEVQEVTNDYVRDVRAAEEQAARLRLVRDIVVGLGITIVSAGLLAKPTMAIFAAGRAAAAVGTTLARTRAVATVIGMNAAAGFAGGSAWEGLRQRIDGDDPDLGKVFWEGLMSGGLAAAGTVAVRLLRGLGATRSGRADLAVEEAMNELANEAYVDAMVTFGASFMGGRAVEEAFDRTVDSAAERLSFDEDELNSLEALGERERRQELQRLVASATFEEVGRDHRSLLRLAEAILEDGLSEEVAQQLNDPHLSSQAAQRAILAPHVEEVSGGAFRADDLLTWPWPGTEHGLLAEALERLTIDNEFKALADNLNLADENPAYAEALDNEDYETAKNLALDERNRGYFRNLAELVMPTLETVEQEARETFQDPTDQRPFFVSLLIRHVGYEPRFFDAETYLEQKVSQMGHSANNARVLINYDAIKEVDPVQRAIEAWYDSQGDPYEAMSDQEEVAAFLEEDIDRRFREFVDEINRRYRGDDEGWEEYRGELGREFGRVYREIWES